MSAGAELHEQHLVDVAEHVPPGDGLSARDVWRRYGKDSPTTIKHWLRELAERGTIQREMRNGRWLYRRPTPAPNETEAV